MTIEFTGKVVSVLALQTGVSSRGPWSRCTVVFEVQDGRYTQKIACENTNNAQQYAQLRVGDTVRVKADVSSREYNQKWYTTALCYEFSKQNSSGTSDSGPI